MSRPSSQDWGPLTKRHGAREQFKKKGIIVLATKRKLSFAGPAKTATAFVLGGACAVILSRRLSRAWLNRKGTDGCQCWHGNSTAEVSCVASWTERTKAEFLLHFGWDQTLLESFGVRMVSIHLIDFAPARRLTRPTEDPHPFPQSPPPTKNDQRTSTPPPPPWILRDAGIRSNIPQTDKQDRSISRPDNRRMDTRCGTRGLHVRRRYDSSHDVDAMGRSFSASFEFASASCVGVEVEGGGARMN
ncbi:hypothetical protein BJ875DRAFT_440398 [Amylocarpus encephaloides]|uniref:Uncharacterized protein n=1 Tax=Amylocarpus encephaloides TaxID=45428 RepID=A0A9P7YLK3_9HELO|nr:hypothetical protein BJ875DRAFT_440398 [Amylocarpus encephaloides]